MSRRGSVGQSEMKLAPEEREVIVTYNDAEKFWRVYSDSATMRGTLLRLARQIGAEIHLVGDHGLEFTCPAAALRLTAKRRARPSGVSLANLRRSPKRPDTVGASRGKMALVEASQDGG